MGVVPNDVEYAGVAWCGHEFDAVAALLKVLFKDI